MTPKEKAIELIKKFEGIVYPYIGSSMLTNEINESVILLNSKICAIIVIEEILNDELQIMPAKWMHNYWEEVKLEIQNYEYT